MSAWRLQSGQRVRMAATDGSMIDVITEESVGWAELRCVRSLDGRCGGMIAAKPDGTIWWVRPLELIDGERGG